MCVRELTGRGQCVGVGTLVWVWGLGAGDIVQARRLDSGCQVVAPTPNRCDVSARHNALRAPVSYM